MKNTIKKTLIEYVLPVIIIAAGTQALFFAASIGAEREMAHWVTVK